MNNKQPDIAMILSHAPKPAAPADLKDTLLNDASKALRRGANMSRPELADQSWFRRWWPVLAPTSVSIACAMVLTIQQNQVSELKQSLDILSPSTAQTPPRMASNSGSSLQPTVAPARPNSDEEIQQLRARTLQLAADIAQLEQLQRENENLRSQLAAASANRFSPDELRAIDDAKRRAERNKCVNNLKQLGLAVRMCANDNDNAFPTNLVSLAPYIRATTLFVCPADTNRAAAKDFTTFTEVNCSYGYYVGMQSDPEQVITLCRIHNNAGLADGSVQQFTPERLVEKDGKFYIGSRQ